MKHLLRGWLLALLPLLALAQPAKERVKLAGKVAEFTPVSGKYMLFLTPGQRAAEARNVAEKQVPGLKVLQELPHPAALVVSMPQGNRPAAGKAGALARTLGGKALRPVYTYADGTEEVPTNTIAVRFKRVQDVKADLPVMAAALQGTPRFSPLDATLGFIDNLPADANPFEVARLLAKDETLVWAEPDMLKFLKRESSAAPKANLDAPAAKAPEASQALTLPNDPMLNLQWYLHNGGRSASNSYWNNSDVKVFEAWEYTQGSTAIKVAIIDEGVDLAHPDLAGQLLPGFDATGLNSGGAPTGNDAHGTACAGIVAGRANNGIGVAGVAPNCKIIPVRIAYSNSSGNWVTSDAWIGNALQWSWKNGQADVLSNSWGGGSSSSLITNPIDSAALKGRGGKGAPVIFAAGNSNTTSFFFPATYSRVIGVAAMTMCDQRKNPSDCSPENWWGSNYGPNVDVSAPGVIMQTLDISGTAGYSTTDYTGTFNGTSSACPTVAGVMALLLSTNPNLTEAQARQLLETTCDKVGTYTYNAGVAGQPNGTWSTDLGYGRVNALRVVNTAANTAFANMQLLNCNATYSNTVGATGGYFSSYACSGANAYPSAENYYAVYLAKNAVLNLALAPTSGEADLFVLKRFHKDSCLAFSALAGPIKDSVSFVAPYAGFYYIVVDGIGGASSYTLKSYCTVPPTITSFAPAVANYGNVVTVTGTNFNPLSNLKLNGTIVAGATANPAGTSITFTVPNNATSGPITVTTTGGTATSATSLIISGQACGSALALTCGDSVTSTNVGAQSIFSTYRCNTWNENGPEKMYTIQGTAGTTLTATLSGMTGDLDLVLLSACHPDSCVAMGDLTLTAALKTKTYYLIVEGYNGATSAFKLKTTCQGLQNCRPTTNCGSGDFIKDVALNTLSNLNTGCTGTGGYTYYQPSGSLTTTLTRGASHSYIVRFGAQYRQKSAIFIDWNNDGDFLDVREAVVLKNVQDSILSGSFTVPTWASLGQVRMRVRCTYTASLDSAGACTNTTYGETEDYMLTVANPAPVLTMTGVTERACTGSDVQVSFQTANFNPNTTFTIWGGTPGMAFIQLNDVAISGSPGSFQTLFPMDASLDSIEVQVEIRASTGQISNRLSYWQFAKDDPQGPSIVERCGPGPMSITLTGLRQGSTVEWYAFGNLVGTGATLDVANQTESHSYFASIANRFGCGSSFIAGFMVNPQPDVTGTNLPYGAPGQTVRVRGTGLGYVTECRHGSLPASFTAEGDSVLVVTVPAGAASSRIYVATLSGCMDSSAVISNTPPPVYDWPITFGNTGEDFVRSIARDQQGNVYASISFTGTIVLQGTTIQAGTKRDGLLAKFTDSGQLLWYTRIGNNTFNTEPRGVNLDGQGNPVWAGSFAGSVSFPNGGAGISLTAAGSYDAFVARLDPTTGQAVWATRVGSTGNDYLYACFVSNSGNVYAGGSYGAAFNFPITGGSIAMPNAGGLDGFIVKLDPNGNGIWANRIFSAQDDEVKAIEYMGGDLVACGYMGTSTSFPAVGSTITLNSAGGRDAWGARINSVGQFVWVKNFGSIFNDEAQWVTVDPSTGNLFVAAQVAGPMSFNGGTLAHTGGNDIAVVGWNFYTQAPVWASMKGSSAGDVPTQIRWDGQRLAVVGYMGGTATLSPSLTLTGNGGNDAFLLRYNKSTGEITSGQLVGSSGDDRALCLATNPATREAYVGGRFSGAVSFPAGGSSSVVRTSAGSFDGFLFRTVPASGAREAAEEPALAAGSLRVYPVPASREVRIRLDGFTAASLEVFDAKGVRMAARFRTEGQEAVLDVTGLRAGMYLVRAAGQSARFVKE